MTAVRLAKAGLSGYHLSNSVDQANERAKSFSRQLLVSFVIVVVVVAVVAAAALVAMLSCYWSGTFFKQNGKKPRRWQVGLKAKRFASSAKIARGRIYNEPQQKFSKAILLSWFLVCSHIRLAKSV